MTAPRPCTAGYSLLEVVVVLAIVALVTVAAVPAIGASVDRMTLSADARTLTSGLRDLRERALDLQTDLSLSVSQAAPFRLNVSDGGAITLAAGTRIAIEPRRSARGAPALVVAWDGTIDGAVALVRGGARVKVTADRLTGRLSVEDAR